MPRKSNTKVHSIYCIDPTKIESKFYNSIPQSKDVLIEQIASQNQKFEVQALKSTINTYGFNVRLYFYDNKQPKNKLSSFCQTFVEDGQKVLKFRTNSSASLLFIWNDNHIFVVTTGQAFRYIEEFCVQNFGLQVAGIFDKFKITAIDSNELSSIVHSTKTIYSNEIDFIDIETLDTIFKEVTGKLTNQTMIQDLLNLDRTSKKKSMKIKAKNSIQFGSALDFNGLINILQILDNYDFQQLTDKFNLIAPLQPKRDSQQISDNKIAVQRIIYDALKNETISGFDLFHKSTNEFISAETYNIIAFQEVIAEVEEIETEKLIFNAYNTYLKEKNDTFDEFCNFFNNCKIEAVLDGYPITSEYLFNHISGEITVSDKTFYIFYGNFFLISEGYSLRLKKTLLGKLKEEIFESYINEVWGNSDIEDDFNRNASINQGYIHLHKIKPELIEFADLLKLENGVVNIVHVKDGFDGTMRELERQVELSIHHALDLQNNNNSSYLEKLYSNASESTQGINISSVYSTKQEFIDVIKNNKLRYIIVLRFSGNLIEARSNIAKHCLNSLILKCFNKGIELKIELVEKNDNNT